MDSKLAPIYKASIRFLNEFVWDYYANIANEDTEAFTGVNLPWITYLISSSNTSPHIHLMIFLLIIFNDLFIKEK